MSKKTGQITVHLSDDYELAVKNLAYADDCSPSEWVHQLIEKELKNRYRQAQDTLNAIGHLQNDEIFESGESYD
ncbi:hypothetical protein ACGTJS_10790 [Faucicola mancuniensis]|uniref:hypothetical protein n=1 Tax=Faucicola mancuniensis TaxID=1309795 RepID=UPI0039777AD4